jgi:carbamoyl-phosphate synthase large subunit
MSDKVNTLVLGVGGNVSQGILKALAISTLPCRVVGACTSPAALGLFTVDHALVSPRAADPSFVPWVLDVCKKERIAAILSGVETVLDVLARNAALIRQETSAIPIVSSPEQLAVANDKVKTCEWLRDHGLHYPLYAASEDQEAVERLRSAVGFPLIAKPRGGKSSEGVVLIRNQKELERFGRQDSYAIEQYLGTPDQEYTAACFSDSSGAVRGCIAFRRELLEGTTVRAEAGAFPEIRQEATAIARELRPFGPCNVQMRLLGSQAVTFEINLRFSGTTPIRARLGFNDVEASIRHYVLNEPAGDLPVIEQGMAVRYWNELYPSVEAVNRLRECRELDSPRRYPSVLEDYGDVG